MNIEDILNKGLTTTPFHAIIKKTKEVSIMQLVLEELVYWQITNNIRDSWAHEDDEDVEVYQSKSLDIICVKRDAEGNIVDAWME